MANVGTSTVAYATQQATGQLVFVASDGTACVLWCDGTNQKFSYASPPYTTWTTTTLMTGLNMALGGKFRAGSDNIDLVTGTSSTVNPTYYPLTKVGATWTVGATKLIISTAAGTAAVGNVMSYCGQDGQGRHWVVCGGASTYTTSRGLRSSTSDPTGSWTSNISTTQTSDVNLPCGDIIGNYLVKMYWNGTAIQVHRLDVSVATLGSWNTPVTIPNLGGSPNASSRMTLRAISATQGLLVYSTGSGIYAQTYTPGTNTWSTAVQLSTGANDRHPTIATDGAGKAWVVWCSYVAANSYALVYKRWDGAVWDTSPTTLIASGTNIANPNAGYGAGSIGVTYTQGTANPYTVGWITFSSLRTFTRTTPASVALSGTDWYGAGWRYQKTLTIAHGQVSGGSDLADFPVLVTFTDTDLKLAPTGKIQNASGFDLIFLDSTGTVQLDHEVEKYDATAGTITAWVRIPTLSQSVDTLITCVLSNSGITTSRENKAGVWDSKYQGVYHLGNGTALSATDSTLKGNNGVITDATATSGQIDGGAAFNGSSAHIEVAGMAPTGWTAFTLEWWQNLTSSANYPSPISYGYPEVTPFHGFTVFIDTAHKPYLEIGNGTSPTIAFFASVLTLATWQSLAIVCDGTYALLYINGSLVETISLSFPSILSSAFPVAIGYNAQAPSASLTGSMDEVHISAAVRTTGWLATAYNNQNAPGTFITPGVTTFLSYSPRSIPLSASLSGITARTLSATAALLPAGTVTRSGSQLFLNGAPFRFSGANIYWLGLAEIPSVGYPSPFQIDDALGTAKEMGATVIRSTSLGVSVGDAHSVETSLGTFNDAAFNTIDYAIKRAGELGIKLLIPFTDNWHFYMGGKHTFTDWRSLSDETVFYTNSTVIADFEAYIAHFLNHVNTYTGVALKNDPTIMAWETGNELYAAPAAWTNTITTYIKSIDIMHLVLSGDTVQNVAPGALTTELAETNLDLFTDHFYPPNTSTLTTNQANVTPSSKAYCIGEYDWTDEDHAAATFSIDSTDKHSGAYSAKITVTAASAYNPYHVQIQQGGFALAASTTYTVSFWAKADAPRSLQVGVSLNHDTYASYTLQTVNITPTWTLYTLAPFTTVGADSNNFIGFNCASATGTIWLDDVTITSGGGNLLTDPGFESGTLSSWVTQVMPSSPLADFLTAIEGNSSIAGDLFWNLYPHADDHGFVIHDDVVFGGVSYTYSLYYPGQTSTQQTNAQALRTHAYTMRGLSVPAALTPAAPTNLVVASGAISWTGTVGAKTYDVERSTTSSSSGYSVIGTGLTDFDTPWTDATAGGLATKWYRVRGYNVDGVAGAYSSVVFIGSPTHTITSSAALLLTSPRTVPSSACLLLVKNRSITPGTTSLLLMQSRSMGATASFFNQALTRISGALVVLFYQALTRNIGTNASLMTQGLTRTVGGSVSLLISRIVPCGASLGIVGTRDIGGTTSLSYERSRTSGVTAAFLLEKARTSASSAAFMLQASRTVGASGTLSVTRSIPGSASLFITRVIPASLAVSLLDQARTMTSTTTLGITHIRTVGSDTALLSEKTRPAIGISSALSRSGVRTLGVTVSLFITRSIPASVILGKMNMTRSLGASIPLLLEKSRTTLASTPILGQTVRSIDISLALLLTQTRGSAGTVALSRTYTRDAGATVALSLLGTHTRTVGASTSLSGGSRTLPVTGSIAVVTTHTVSLDTALSQEKTRPALTASASLYLLRSRNVTSTVPLLLEKSRQVTSTGSLFATFIRSCASAVSLQGGVTRVLPTGVALIFTGERTFLSGVSLSAKKARTMTADSTLTLEEARSGIAASVALSLEVSRGIASTVALLGEKIRQVTCTISLTIPVTRTLTSTTALQGEQALLITTSLALLEGLNTRTIESSTALSLEKVRSGIGASGALLATMQRTVGGQVAILAIRTRSIAMTGAYEALRSREVPATVALLLPGSIAHTIPTGAVLSGTASRVISTTVTLEIQRVMPCTVAFSEGRERTIPAVSSLTSGRDRYIPCTVALSSRKARVMSTSVAFVRVIPNAVVEVRSGRVAVLVKGGMRE